MSDALAKHACAVLTRLPALPRSTRLVPVGHGPVPRRQCRECTHEPTKCRVHRTAANTLSQDVFRSLLFPVAQICSCVCLLQLSPGTLCAVPTSWPGGWRVRMLGGMPGGVLGDSDGGWHIGYVGWHVAWSVGDMAGGTLGSIRNYAICTAGRCSS